MQSFSEWLSRESWLKKLTAWKGEVQEKKGPATEPVVLLSLLSELCSPLPTLTGYTYSQTLLYRKMSLGEQYTMLILLNGKTFQPKGLCHLLTCKQLTKTFGSKCPAIEYYELCIAHQVIFRYQYKRNYESLHSITNTYPHSNSWCDLCGEFGEYGSPDGKSLNLEACTCKSAVLHCR